MNKITALLSIALACGCAKSEADKNLYDIDVEAIDDQGSFIAGIDVAIGETHLGTIASDGHLRARVSASDGQRFSFHAQCPDGYSSEAIPTEVVFRNSRGLAGKKSDRLHFRIECSRNERVIALLVHSAGHAGVPIRVDGETLGLTDANGLGHFRIDRKPGAQFEVSIDDTAFPSLVANNARQTIVLGAEDDLIIYDPEFVAPVVVEKKKRRRRKKRSAEKPVRKRPIRID